MVANTVVLIHTDGELLNTDSNSSYPLSFSFTAPVVVCPTIWSPKV